MHLAIATRKDPPLPLPRLRARGQLIELRQADLRFTTEETAAFLRRGMGVELSTEDVVSLVSRTEGWIAGLQMAALSIRDREDVSRLIAAFGGSHEYIVDYFAAEVLDQQPEPIKTFLLQTSILDRLCGSLCDAVTGQTDGQHTLEQLQQANLFVVPLDNDRGCYRYHHLFRDLLLKQLQQEQPEIVPELHRRASQWCEEHELIDEAIDHALAAHDEQRLGRLLDRSCRGFLLARRTRDVVAVDRRAVRRSTPGATGAGHSPGHHVQRGWQESRGRVALAEVDQTLSNLDEHTPAESRVARSGGRGPCHGGDASRRSSDHPRLCAASIGTRSDESGWHSSVLFASSNAYFLLGDLAACIEDLSEAH